MLFYKTYFQGWQLKNYELSRGKFKLSARCPENSHRVGSITALSIFPRAMKLLLDQGLPWSTARLLRETGINTVHVSEIGYYTSEDGVILERGRGEDCAYVFSIMDSLVIAANGCNLLR